MTKATTPWAIMADIAAARIGERELSNNQSPFIRLVWIESGIGVWGYEQRLPWCAAFVSWAIMKAVAAEMRCQKPFKLTASVEEFDDRCIAGSLPRIPWQDARKGDVVSFRPHFSHIGIVEEAASGGLITIEGNTNAMGAREGNGVWRKEREPREIGKVWALPCGLGIK